MKKTRKILSFILLFVFLLSAFSFVGCSKKKDTRDDRYVLLMLTNKNWEEGIDYMPSMKQLYGEIQPETGRMYAAGFIGPMLLTQSIEQMRKEVNDVFDAAEKYNVPVYFQLDDNTNYSTLMGSGAEVKFYEDPEMCEWIAFKQEGETFGGENISKEQNNGVAMLPRFWFNWSVFTYSPAFPNLASEKLQNLVVNNLKEGFIKPLMERYQKLIDKDKAYLFAGCAIGWETHIPDYSPNNMMLAGWRHQNPPPTDVLTGKRMLDFEFAQYGYGALTSLGYDQAKLDAEAASLNLSTEVHMKNILLQVIHDYSELLAKTVYDAGVPKTKIYTHMVGHQSALSETTPTCTFYPPMWCAVNDYSTPGWTLSPITCPYNITNLKARIAAADPNQQYFGLTEGYASGFTTAEKATEYFNEIFGNGGRVVAAFGFGDTGSRVFPFEMTSDFPYTVALNKWIAEGVTA